MLQSQESDTYGLRRKLPEPTRCPTCGAVYRDGRWTWGFAPSDAHQTACPACRRTADDYPAGIVSVSGAFALQHADEIRNLARGIGEAFEHAYHGDLEYTFSEAENALRVNWRR